MKRLCACGCGKPTPLAKSSNARLGRVKGEPVKFLQGHNGRRTAEDYRVSDTGCWVWLRRISRTGYGQMTRGGKVVPAHRVYFESRFGPVPEGKDLDHLCRNRACVNPKHLEPVSRAVNSRRGSNTKLTSEEVAEIRSLVGAGSTHRSVAERFGIARQTVGDIVNGRRWVAK